MPAARLCSANGMVLVDSAPWIDLLSGADSPESRLLEQWLLGGAPVATTGVVLQEVLQGARTERDLNLLRARLGRLAFLRADKETHVEAHDCSGRLGSAATWFPQPMRSLPPPPLPTALRCSRRTGNTSGRSHVYRNFGSQPETAIPASWPSQKALKNRRRFR